MSQDDKDKSPLYYADYLGLDALLSSQKPRSDNPFSDETLFIVVHQTYELWFKQVLHELDLVITIFSQEEVNDNSGETGLAVQKLKRIIRILEVLNQQMSILETMTPMDFLEFRNLLFPASGFQSLQFRLIEIKLGLRQGQRFKANYYKNARAGALNAEDAAAINAAETQPTLKQLVIQWAERTPFLADTLWSNYQRLYSTEKPGHGFWDDYQHIYAESLSPAEKTRLKDLQRVMYKDGLGDFSQRAIRAVLFIMLYRNLPLMQLPYELLAALIEIDQLLSNWRYRHMMATRRMIGMRIGTGGTSGAGYLEGALQEHYIFSELNEVTTFLVERSRLPQLPPAVMERMSFNPGDLQG